MARFTTTYAYAFAKIYVPHSPYAYVANNPVNFIDVNGDHILPDDAIVRFPRLAQYLKTAIKDILDNKKL